MSVDYLMGIDLGTSGAKTLILEPSGKVIATASSEYAIQSPRQGWAEQDPHVWYAAVIESIRASLSKASVNGDEITALSFSGQMHGTVCLDTTGEVIRHAIIWADQRSHSQLEEIISRIGSDRLGEWTANPLATGFMLPTWMWLRENEIRTSASTRWLLLPKDYLRLRFTGEIGTEPSDASSTLLFDPVAKEWSLPLLEALDVDISQLPPVFPSAEVAGGLLPIIAEETGLSSDTPVIFGGSDQACQALGNGAIEPGVISCTIGTGGQLLAPLNSPTYDRRLRLHLFCHVLADRWFLEAATLSAGLSLKWLRDQVLLETDYRAMADLAAQSPPGAEGLFYLPYLVGERTPWMDPQARAGFIGLTLRHTQSHLVRAVMEGVVFSLKQGLELMGELGVSPERILASGGATNHPLWLQLQADIFNRPIYRTRTVEASAFGAALLAGVGAGVYPDLAAASERTVQMQDEVIEPIRENVEVYEEAIEVYKRLYPTLNVLISS
jgi:xylulokinase